MVSKHKILWNNWFSIKIFCNCMEMNNQIWIVNYFIFKMEWKYNQCISRWFTLILKTFFSKGNRKIFSKSKFSYKFQLLALFQKKSMSINQQLSTIPGKIFMGEKTQQGLPRLSTCLLLKAWSSDQKQQYLLLSHCAS